MTYRALPANSGADLLRKAKHLRGLLGQAERLARLQQLLLLQLQPAAREHCHVASFRDGSLLLVITDGNWATRLRYQQRRLLRQLQALEQFQGLQRLLFKVQPPATPAAGRGPCAPLSSDASSSIKASAEHIRDPRLRAALERLASHVAKD